jgi:ABC-type uncharacterized transport system YnjBCD ATPase subunit
MISDITLKFGKAAGLPVEIIHVAPVNIFVGPNNSGKSKILNEIEQRCVNGNPSAQDLIIENIRFNGIPEAESAAMINRLIVPPNQNETVGAGNIILASRRSRLQINQAQLANVVHNPEQNLGAFASWFLSHFTIKLDGPGRVKLVDQQNAGDLIILGHSTLQVLFRDDAKRAEVRRIVYDAFGIHIVIDPTLLGHLRVRLSIREPVDPMEERGIHQAAVDFHSHALPIDSASDGVKAFTGIITELIAGDPKVLLIDEPDAFLHPALASKLGQEVSRAAVTSNKIVFASTHSPMFVMGCIQSGAPINIVRLTYRAGIATARILPSDEILRLMRNPLLRSTGVLQGLFYEFVVVTESDADRAFYQEINDRLLKADPQLGIPNCLFLNAQGKHTIHTILRPLRKLGIPAVGIYDVDALNEGGTNWANILEAASIPEIERNALATLRAAIKHAFDATGLDVKRAGGISILQQQDQEAAQNLLRQIANYGIFIVPKGELEFWLHDLNIGGHGPTWLIEMFERMGDDPDGPYYIRPTEGDVWQFISQVRSWLVDPNRQGIPT